jgi:hypothetical protein
VKGLFSIRLFVGRHRFALLLLLVIVVGAILQVFVATSQWVDQDEGQYIQAALVVSHGGFPLVTFPSRAEPVIPILLAPVVVVFGSGVLVGRGFELVFNILTAAIIALLARRICSVRGDVAALASAGIYLIAPLAIQQNTLVIDEPVAAFFVAASLFFLMRERWSAWPGNYPISGLLLGLAILSRRSAIAVGVVWLVWIFYVEGKWRDRVIAALRCFWPGVIVTAGYFLYVVKETSFQWAVVAFSTDARPYGQYLPTFGNKVEILGYLMLMAAPLMLVPLILLVNVLRAKGMPSIATVATILGAIVVSILLVCYPFEINWGMGETISPNIFRIVVIAFLFWLVMIIGESISEFRAAAAEGAVLLLLAGWGIAMMLVDLLPRPLVFVTYSSDAFAPLSLLFGVWFVTLIPRGDREVGEEQSAVRSQSRRIRSLRDHAVPVLVITLMVTSSAMVGVWVIGPSNNENHPGAFGLVPQQGIWVPGSEIQDGGSYLKSAMSSSDTIFTFDTAFADAAGRVISPPIAQYLDQYDGLVSQAKLNNVSLDPTSPPGFLPTLEGLLSYWNSTKLTWIVDGPFTQSIAAGSPLFNWYLNTQYHPVATFGDPLSYDTVVMLHRGAPPAPVATEFASSFTSSNPVGVSAYNGTMYVASLNSPFVTTLSQNGANGTIPLLFHGARSIGEFDGYLWVGSTLTSQVEIIPLGGGAPELLSVGSGPSSFATDNGTGAVFVSTYTSGSITAIGMTANHTWWHTLWTASVAAPISGLAVNVTSTMLYAALPNNNTIVVVNDTNGKVLERQVVPFAPYALAYAQGGLVATWWAGHVYRLDISNGTAIRVVGSTVLGPNLPEVVSLPSLGAVAIPSEIGNDVAILDARTLLPMGTFQGISGPSAVVYNASSNCIGVTDTVHSQADWLALPPYDQVTITGPNGANVTVNGHPLASYQLPVTLKMWPEVLSVTVSSQGYMPGFAETTLPSWSPLDLEITTTTSPVISVMLQVSLGPSIASIQSLENTFTSEVVIMSVLAFIGGVSLTLYSEPETGKDCS